MIDLPCKKYNTTWSQFFPIIYFIQFCSDAGISVMSLRGSAGHQEQFKHFTLLGTKLYLQTNSAKKYILLFWPPISLILIFLFICILWGGGGSLGKNLSEMPFPSQIDMVIPWQQLYKGLKRIELLLQSNPHSWPSFFIAVVSQFFGFFPFFFTSFDGVAC